MYIYEAYLGNLLLWKVELKLHDIGILITVHE